MTRKRAIAHRIGWGALAAFLALCVWRVPALRAASQLERSLYNVGGSEAAIRNRNASAFGMILGEIRATAADLLFMKTTRYLHAGIAYAPKKNVDLMGKTELDQTCGPGTATQIRSKQDDFRGFLGDLEREVKPYRHSSQAHTHTQKAELIPWYRIMTLSNPRYVRGYRVGGMTLADEGHWQSALDFITEGLRNNDDNPEVFLLYQTLALFHVRGKYQKAYPWGDKWLPNALDAARESYRRGLAERPELGEEGKIASHLTWSDDLEEDFLFSANLVPILLRDQGRLEEALERAREVRRIAPSSQPAERLVRDIERQLSAAAESTP
ncbi:hypothetical protein JW916_13610 [Candidatus Sumerlaeota bacterium]|nr:hypothetical protein [Candidatus Sumerlaeota bacterium]